MTSGETLSFAPLIQNELTACLIQRPKIPIRYNACVLHWANTVTGGHVPGHILGSVQASGPQRLDPGIGEGQVSAHPVRLSVSCFIHQA